MKKFLYLIIILLAVQGCRDDDCPIEPDPCSEYPEEMEIDISVVNPQNINEYIPSIDSIFVTPRTLLFQTNFEYDSIRWQIGSDPEIRTVSSLPLRFENNVQNTSIRINAMGYRPINKECFGEEDDGIDTLSRIITFRNREDSPLYGVWRGTNDGEKDSFNVEIQRLYYTNSRGETFFDGTRFTGLPKGTKTYEGENHSNVYWFDLFGSRDGPDENRLLTSSLQGRLQPDGRIIIRWQMGYVVDAPQRTFTGIKIE